jgi:hypothetical protein
MVSRHSKDLLHPKVTVNLPSNATINNNRCRINSNILLQAVIRPSKATASSHRITSMVARLRRVSMERLHHKDSTVRRLHRDSTERHHHRVNMAHHRHTVNMVHLLRVTMELLHNSKANTARRRLRDSMERHHRKDSMVLHHRKDSMVLHHRKGNMVHHKANTARHSPVSIKLHRQAAVSAARPLKHHSATVPSALPTST